LGYPRYLVWFAHYKIQTLRKYNREKNFFSLSFLVHPEKFDLLIYFGFTSTEDSLQFSKRIELKGSLNYIFIPNEWQHRVSDKIVTTSLTKSDHSALITSVSLLEDTKIGKSFYKINPTLYEESGNVEELKAHIREQINSIPTHWDPHMKWEYIKMQIRKFSIRF
jgi:hypothetical protein